MKNELKISTLSLVCVLCTTAVSGAYGAASVRSLGGAGTYTSASSAASAGASGAMRGGSVRVTPTTGKTTAANAPSASATTGRTATTPRLSIGRYLPGGTSVSGGSSIKYPSGGGSSSTGGGSMDPGSASELRSDIRALQKDVADLQAADNDLVDALDTKLDSVPVRSDGFIEVDSSNGEIYVNTESLAGALKDQGLVGDVDFRVADGEIQWSRGDDVWAGLIAIEELKGAAGIQGEKGDKGDKGETGPMGPQGPAGTIDTDAMNAAIDTAIANKDWSEFAKASELMALGATVASKADQSALNTLSNTVRGMYSNDEIDTALAGKQPAGNYATAEQLNQKADKSELNGYATKEQLGAYATTDQLSAKQDKLTAGANISIVDGVIDTKGIATTDGLAALENKVASHDTALSTLDGSVTALDGQVGTIAETVATVSDKADAAQADATAAKTAADAAQATANTAATDAATALSGLRNVYTKTESDGKYATKDEIPSLDGYAKSADVATTYETKANATATYATKTDLDGKLDSGALTGYAKAEDIAATYETKAHATATYATKDEIPSLDGYAKSADVYTAQQTNTLLDAKQDALTFDTAPTLGSTNPVTSGGVAKAISDAQMSGQVDLTGYATEQYVQDYVNMPATTGNYMLTVKDGQKQWTTIAVVGADGKPLVTGNQ